MERDVRVTDVKGLSITRSVKISMNASNNLGMCAAYVKYSSLVITK